MRASKRASGEQASVRARVRVCVRACVHVLVCVCVPARLPACIRACLNARMPVALGVCLPACMHACIPACLCACLPAPSLRIERRLTRPYVVLYRRRPRSAHSGTQAATPAAQDRTVSWPMLRLTARPTTTTRAKVKRFEQWVVWPAHLSVWLTAP